MQLSAFFWMNQDNIGTVLRYITESTSEVETLRAAHSDNYRVHGV